MYFVMTCDLALDPDGAALMEIHNSMKVGTIRSWRGGRLIEPAKAATIPNPIEIDFDPLRGYQGPPLEMVDLGIPVMSRRLAAALREAGVDNVQFFPATLRNTVTGERYPYEAFNVVGAVAAADLERSDWSSYDGVPVADVSFETLVLDEAKAGTLRMFRLAENINALLVDEQVRDHVLKTGIDTLQFIEPQDWMHL